MLRQKLHSPFTVECTEGNLLWKFLKVSVLIPLLLRSETSICMEIKVGKSQF